MSDLASSVLDSLFQPGLNTPMKKAMDLSFYGLFIVLGGLSFLTGGNFHVLALLAIAIALFCSINWFLSELAKMPPAAREVQQTPLDAPAGTSSAPAVPEASEPKKER